MPNNQKALVQIGEAAAQTDLSLRTLRHWDDVGLVRPSARSNGGFRMYSQADIKRIQVIKSMKPLALSLAEIQELLGLIESADAQGVESRKLERRVRHYMDRTRVCIARLNRDLDYATELLEILAAAAPTKG
jgi:DNA-binding transcriptional MerR regulator